MPFEETRESTGHAERPQPPEDLATGDAAVDEVLASVAALDERPVEEHVVVFEQAHERLRRALDARTDS